MTDPVPVSTDKSKIDLDALCGYLQGESYWAKSRSRDEIVRSVENSLCYSLLRGETFVGFARVITDGVTFAYLCDVFVKTELQRTRLGEALLTAVVQDERLRGVPIFLMTKDAHGFYEKHGFASDDILKRIVMRRK